jgi:hypothetical protein
MKAARQVRLELRAYVSALLLPLCLISSTSASDWPQYHGPNHDGISLDRLNKQWSGAVTNPIWRIPLTNCLGSMVVSGGRLFTQTRRLTNGFDREVCVALDAASGAELWADALDNALYPESGVGYDDGPRTTPAVDGSSVFLVTSYLKLFRLNVTNGAIVWQRDLVSSLGGVVLPWQHCASPVIENGLIFVNINSSSSSLMALHTSDGSVAWRTQNDRGTHSTPTLATIQGVRQIIFATQTGLVSLDPPTGNFLWRTTYPFSYGTSLSVSPVVDQDMVFICGAHSYGMGSVVYGVALSNSTWTTTRLWSTNNPAAPWMTPIVRDGFLYGQFGIQTFDSANAQLKCVDMRTGAVKWSVNGFGRGATILVDDHLISLTERGDLVLSKPVTNAYTELARFNAIPNYSDPTNKCWNQPAVSDGKLFVRSTAFVASYDFSVPPLVLSTPQFIGNGVFDLWISATKAPTIDSNRFANIELLASPDPRLALTQWNRVSSALVLTNGRVRAPGLNTGTETQQFFIVSEPK